MKSANWIILFFLSSILTVAQNNRRNVLQSDISGIYKDAVKKSFYRELNHNYYLSRGYYGMVDLVYSLGIGDYIFERIEINTIHGFQFNPFIFVGGGIGFHFMSEYFTDDNHNTPLNHRNKFLDIPIFADIRFTCLKKNITPFIDIKTGYYLTHHGGIYTNASIGCRFAVWYKHAITIAIGYTYENLEFDSFNGYTSHYNLNQVRYYKNFDTNSISFKIGYEF